MQEQIQPHSPEHPALLTPQESKILSLIRSGKYQTINIRFKENSPYSLDLTQNHDPKKRLVDLLRQNPYQNLTVKSHQGKITHIEQTTKLIIE